MHCVFLLLSLCFLISSCSPLSLKTGPLDIPQVDYEPFLRPGFYNLPELDLKSVNFSRIVNKTHVSVTLENEHLRVIVLPEMGRVYRIISKRTGHDVLWRNDVATPGGANNKLGWWLWIGGIEYTLPGEEHGYTWAIPWKWKIKENSTSRKAIQLTVKEPSTGLVERLTLSLGLRCASLRADIDITNPGVDPTKFAHWTNVPMVPGGKNELEDDTVFEIPTKEILIAKRWQQNLGRSPQNWQTSQLRSISGWNGGMGDFTAKGMTAGYFGTYAAMADEGVLRIFNSTATPGLDTWTYGFHPKKDVIPGEMNRSNGYAEMWGGNVKTFPDERAPIDGNNSSIFWTEWIHPYHGVHAAPLVFADSNIIVHATWDKTSASLMLYFSHSSSDFRVSSIGLWSHGKEISEKKKLIYASGAFCKYSVIIKTANVFLLNAIIRLNHMHLSSARKFQAGMGVEVKSFKIKLGIV